MSNIETTYKNELKKQTFSDKDLKNVSRDPKQKHILSLKQDHKFSNTLKETFVEFSYRTDVNAYGKIFTYENKFVKFLWLIVLLASLSLTALIMIDNVSIFFKYEVVSQIGVVYETPTEFPAVTFCDNTPFTKDPPPIQDKQPLDLFNLQFLYLMSASAPPPYFDDDKRKKLGLSIWQIQNSFWPYCKFNNTDCSNDLHWYWSYDYGNCFQFNVGRN